MIPSKMFLTSGVGEHEDKLISFEMALRNAGIEKYNLVLVSSILPPNCEIITKEEGTKALHDGEIVFCVLSKNQTNEKGKEISSAVGVSIPINKELHGYIAEYSSEGEEKDVVCRKVESLAKEMLDTKHQGNIPSKEISIIQSAKNKSGKWVTTIAAAVFVP